MVGTLASPALSLTPHANRSRPGRCGPAAGVGWLLHIVLLSGALMATSADACTCRDRRLPEEDRIINAFADARYVMLAQVLSVAVGEVTPDGSVRTTGSLRPIESFKGDGPDELPIEARHHISAYASSCNEGLPGLSEGELVLLYLHSFQVDEWTFNHCSRSRLIDAPDLDPEVIRLRGMQGGETADANAGLP